MDRGRHDDQVEGAKGGSDDHLMEPRSSLARDEDPASEKAYAIAARGHDGSSTSSFWVSSSSSSSPRAGGVQERHHPPPSSSIGPNDVLGGKRKSSFHHAGNERFRDAIAESLPAYRGASTKRGRGLVVQALVETIWKSGGRFLKEDMNDPGRWNELDDQEARDKVCRALRDASRKVPEQTDRPRRHRADRRREANASSGYAGTSVGESDDSSAPSMPTRWTTNSAPEDSWSDGIDAAAKAHSALRFADASMPPALSTPQRKARPADLPATPTNASISAVGSDLSAQSTDPFLETIDTLLGPLSPGEEEEVGSDPFASVPRARRRAV